MIRFVTADHHLDRLDPVTGLGPGDWLLVVVQDDGQGMDAEVLSRIFTPFFTTKPLGQGTGLGLAGVYGAMREHGGIATAESQSGKGSIFRLWFPIGPHPLPEPPTPVKGLGRMGRGRILLVDDDAAVRGCLATGLRQAGFEVMESDDGEAGWGAFGRNRPDLVVLDLAMPRCDGATICRRIRQADPELPVLLISGFGREEEIRELQHLGRVRFIAKPFRIEELLQEIADLLR